MNLDNATTVAVAGLQYLAGDTEQLSRFLALTGLGVDELRASATEPDFQAAILDYFLGHEPTLLAFAASAGIEPGDVKKARFALARPDESETW